MTKSVFNIDKKLDYTKQPMFFGKDLQVQRYDELKYPIFNKLFQQQLGYFWRPEEVSLQKDIADYKVSTREYSVDNVSKWTAGDSDKHHYELTESERLQAELEPIND